MKTEHWLLTLRRRSAGLVAALVAPAMMIAAPMGAVAQEQEIDVLTLRSYPLAIHQGTCETVVAEPSYDLGFLVPRALYVQQDDEAVADAEAYDTGVFDPIGYGGYYGYGEESALADEEAQNEPIGDNSEFLFDDVDGDGYYDYGLDLNRDSILDQAEIVERPILWAYESDLDDIDSGIGVEEEGVLDGEDVEDAEVDDLRATPHVLMVHGDSVVDTNYLACGEIQGTEDEDGQIAFAIRPLTDNGFVGVASMEEGDTGFLGIGGDSGEVQVWVLPSRVGQAVGQPAADGA